MQIRNRLFSYPVYSYEVDDYKANHFTFDYDVETDGNSLFIQYKTVIENKHIQKMLNDNLVDLTVLIECPRTSYRNLFVLKDKEGYVEIPSSCVSFRVDVCCLLVAKKYFVLDKKKGISRDYGDTKFEIQKGFIVGYDNTYPFMVDKDKEDEFKASSIISAVKKLDLEDYTDVYLDDPDKIKIQLSAEMYNKFVQLQGQDQLPVVHSMIVLPALVYVIDQIKNREARQIYQDCYWYRSIAKQLGIMHIGIDSKEFIKKSSLEIAQRLLKTPVKKALDNLTVMNGEE